MRGNTVRLRFFAVLAMMMGLLAGLGASPALAQDDDSEMPEPERAITIYNAICEGEPADGDYYAACYGNPASGSIFRIGVPNSEQFTDNQVTDSNGYVTFGMDISASNSVRIIQELPGNAIDWAAYCTSESGLELPLTYVTDYPGLGVVDVDLSAAPEEAVNCDWYTVIPAADEQRSITIYNAYCEGEPADGAYFEECHANSMAESVFRVGVPFTDRFSENQTTDNDGYVTFDVGLSETNRLRIVQELPAHAIGWAAYCTSESGTELPLTYVTDYEHLGVVDVDLSAAPTEDVRCDWYTVFAADGASPAPSGAPSAAPTLAPSAAPSTPGTGGDGSGVVTLPNTGAGTATENGFTGTFALIAGALAALVVTVGLRLRRAP